MSNRFPQMPIRAKYADKTTEGVNIDEALESSVKNVVVADIKAIDGAILSELKCGDIVSKEDATGKHAYVVTFKKDNTGLCLTYDDGSGYIETVSYDYTDSAWVYNSTDVFNGSNIDGDVSELKTTVHNVTSEDFTKTGDLSIIGTLKADGIETDDYIKPKTADMQINVSPSFMGETRTLASADADITEGITSGSGTATFDFVKARVSNGKMNIVFTGHLTIGNEALVIGGRTRFPNWSINLPQSILSKIYPIDGGLYNVVLGGKTYCYQASSGGVPPYKNHFIDDSIFYTLAKKSDGVIFETSLSNTTFQANQTFAFRIEVNIVL